ncbi:DUF4352 domain-containing protein [Bacillus sp. Hm123]|uniref:DUF4352 domain-containing protein n=1 Tax=Bacillus sp. Hm123 TaxID=3450745 RepID=UPI003F42A152
MKKFMKIVAIVFGILIAIGVIGSLGEDKSASEDGESQTLATEEKVNEKDTKDKESKTFNVGDEVKVGELAYKVTNVTATNEIKSDNQFIESAKTDGQFILVDIEAVNNDKKARMVDSNMFKVKDNSGREFEPTSDSEVMMAVEGAMDFFLQDINPGISKKGKVVFELPQDSSSYSLEVSSGFGWSGGEYEKIKLK